jgi:hypothetical protein
MMKRAFLHTWANVGVGLILTVMVATPAAAVEVKLSGQINRAIMYADNGNDTELFHVDNNNSSTRFRLTGEQAFDKVTVGVVWENEFISNNSASVDIGQNSDGEATFNERKLEAWFGGAFGRFWIGQGDGAANSTSEVDLSGTDVIMYSGVAFTAGGINFRDDDDTAIARIDQTRSNFDGLSRNDRLRYDTPVFSGFTLSASTTDGNAWELAGRWSREFEGIGKLAAAIGYVDNADRGNLDNSFTQIGASASWLHPTGINFTIAYGEKDIEDSGDDPVNYYAKLGYLWSIHALAVEYGQTDDLAQKGDKSSNYGAAYVIKPWDGVEFYGLLRFFSLDRDGVNANDISQFMIGTRVKF